SAKQVAQCQSPQTAIGSFSPGLTINKGNSSNRISHNVTPWALVFMNNVFMRCQHQIKMNSYQVIKDRHNDAEDYVEKYDTYIVPKDDMDDRVRGFDYYTRDKVPAVNGRAHQAS